MPLMLVVAPPWSAETPGALAYWSVVAATVMWIVERIAFFTLIRDKGAVYTIQAVYVATPAAVIFAAIFFGGGLRHLAVAVAGDPHGGAVAQQFRNPQATLCLISDGPVTSAAVAV